MELVNGAKAEWKPEKENCTVYSFPGVAACGEPGCGSQREQMIKVICFFVVLAIYTAWLSIKMELVNGRKLFNLSVSYADSSLYQREPCNSFGLKCWFAIKSVQEREPILRFIWLDILHRFTDFQSTLPVFAKRSHHSPLLKEGRFAVCLIWYFVTGRGLNSTFK